MRTMKVFEESVSMRRAGFIPFVLRSGIMYCSGTFQIEEDRICISDILARQHMKYFIDHLVKKFKTNKILFFCVMDFDHFSGLRDFRRCVIWNGYDTTECLEGEWECEF